MAAEDVAQVVEGSRVAVPIDTQQVNQLSRLFAQLSVVKQDFLLTRFPHCDSDEEACRLMVERGDRCTTNMTDRWKATDGTFKECYRILSGRLVDWARFLAYDIEAGNALLAAIENRKLLLMPWKDLGAREATEKGKAGSNALDRIIGRKQQVDARIIKIEDLLPPE